MPRQKFNKLKGLKTKSTFIMPGSMTANINKEDVFKNFVSPFDSEGNFIKVLFEISPDFDNTKTERTCFVDLCN